MSYFVLFSEEIFVSVDNVKCLLKLKGLPYDLHETDSETFFPDVKGIMFTIM